MVGSPPENCTLICRFGLIVIALSSSVFTSFHVSSCTNPTWLASMKHGSHIMLQRFVRSTVRTLPRPWVMVLEPWWCSLESLCARMSRPGNTCSRCLKNAVSMAITSSKWPWIGQSFTIRILPSRSMTCALISPGFSLYRTSTGALPSRICWRTSGMQRGHSESVSRGQPRGGFVFSHDFKSGLSLHFGVKPGFWPIWFTFSKTVQAAPAAIVNAFSAYLIGLCISFELLQSDASPSRGSSDYEQTRTGYLLMNISALKASIGKGALGKLRIVIKLLILWVVRCLCGLNGAIRRSNGDDLATRMKGNGLGPLLGRYECTYYETMATRVDPIVRDYFARLARLADPAVL